MPPNVGKASAPTLEEDTKSGLVGNTAVRDFLGDGRFTKAVLGFLMEIKVGYVRKESLERKYDSASCVRCSFASFFLPFFLFSLPFFHFPLSFFPPSCLYYVSVVGGHH